MRKLIFILFIVVPFLSFGQPGGGGGVIIHNIFDIHGKRVDVAMDSTYKLHCFLLKDTILATTNVYSKLEFQTIRYRIDSLLYDSFNNRTRIISVSAKFKAIKLSEISPNANYRMLLSKGTDTMIVDFINVIGDNPVGLQSQIDSLVFQPGYYQYKKEEMHAISYPNDTLWTITYLKEVDFKSLSTSKNKSIKPYSKSRLKKQRKEYRKKVLKERLEWVNDPQRIVQKNERKEKKKRFIDRYKKDRKAEKQKQKQKNNSSKRYKKEHKEALKYRRKLKTFKIRGMNRNQLIHFILNYEHQIYTKEYLESKTDKQVYKIAEQIADNKRKENKIIKL